MTTWSDVSKQTNTTWSTTTKRLESISVTYGEGYYGEHPYGGREGNDWSDVDKVTDTLWSNVEQQSSTWVQSVKSGTVGAQFEYNEPLGGPEWSEVDKDE